jgi:putative transposase
MPTSSTRPKQAWPHLKRSHANLAKRNLAQLTALVRTRLMQMPYRPSLLNGFLPGPASTSRPAVIPTLKDR